MLFMFLCFFLRIQVLLSLLVLCAVMFFLLYSIILILCVLSFIAIVIITVFSLCSDFGE